MAKQPERRHRVRLPVPSKLAGPGAGLQRIRLVDLSPEGACLEHARPLPDWDFSFVILPPALGGFQLQGEVVWSRAARRTEGAAGKAVRYSHGGLRFPWLTLGQRAGLTDALEILKAAQRG